ncbi:Acg family FMN-binding oxidoreductase [Bacteroides sp.]
METKINDYHYLIEQAIKAPSGHNTQSWLFHIRPNSIEIHPDNEKTLPIVDGDKREMFISLGCATENLCIAAEARGYQPTISLCDTGNIEIRFTIDNQKNKSDASLLLPQISIRQTNRSVYNGKIIPETELQELLSIEKAPSTHLHCWKNGTPEFNRISSYVLEGNNIQMNDADFKNELKSWMRFNKKHEQARKDGLSYAVFGAPNLPQWISRPIIAACLTPKMQNKGDEKKLKSSSHIVLFTVEEDKPAAWINLGRVLERFLLKTTEAGIATAFINQPCEVKTLSKQLQQEVLRKEDDEIPVVLLRLGYALPMPYAPRKEPNQVIIYD